MLDNKRKGGTRLRSAAAIGVSLIAAYASLALFPLWRPWAKANPRPGHRTVEVTYRFVLRDVPSAARQVTAWVPLPLSDQHQSLERFRLEPDWPYSIVTDPDYGNRFLRLDLPPLTSAANSPFSVSITFRVSRQAHQPARNLGVAAPVAQESLARFLVPDRLVPIDGEIAAEARRVARAAHYPREKARRLYDHIVDTVAYDKSGYGWGRGDALYACTVRAGNCTDFHSLFIGEARSLGIPARFVMGLPLPSDQPQGDIPGYHCWAEFYVEGHGWLPVDASEASKRPDSRDSFFGALDENRIAFSVGRDVTIPQASAPPLNYVIYPYVEVDGGEFASVETAFSFRNVGENTRS